MRGVCKTPQAFGLRSLTIELNDERGERHSRRITGPAQMSDVLAAKNAKDTKSLIFVLKHQPTDEWQPPAEGLGVDAPDPRG